MTDRITSMPEQTSVTCVQLPGQETDLARGEMVNTSGGCILPGGEPIDPLENIIDLIEDAMSEWWDFW